MAVSDDDWKKFLESTEEDPDEVETSEEEDETEEPEEAEPKKQAKKSEKKGDDEEADDSDETSEEEDVEEEDSEDEKTAEDTYKPRLKQFLKDDGTVDLKKLEDSYVASGKQSVKLENELKESKDEYNNLLAAIKSKPEAAKLLFGEEGAKKLAQDSSISQKPGSGSGDGGTTHPLLQHLEAQMKNKGTKEYDDFVELHPEAITDPEKRRKIGVFLKQHGAIYREENNGEIPTMKESLEAAYRYYGWDLEIDKKESVAAAAKKTASTRTTPQRTAKATKKAISKSTQFFAEKLGVKLK